MKKLNCLIAAFLVFLVQSAVLPFMFNGVSQPNLIFVFVILMALHHGQRVGIITALLGGFCQDVVIGNFFGIHLLPYLILAVVCSYIGRDLEKDRFLLTLLIVLGATEVNLVLTGGILAITGQYINIVSYIVEYSIPMLIYHGIVTVLIDSAVWKLRREDRFYGYMSYRY